MTWSWLWRSVIEPSWLSIVSAPFVVAGYVLLGRERREGWLCPALLRYFSEPPAKLYIQVKAAA